MMPFDNPLSLGVGVGSLLLAEAGDDVDEPAVVLDASLGTAGLLLFLLLGLDLRGLTTDLAGTGQRAVNLEGENRKAQMKWQLKTI